MIFTSGYSLCNARLRRR